MPQKPLTAHILICEHVLEEKEGVFSAIRPVDLFAINVAQPPVEGGGVLIKALVQMKSHADDSEPHHFRLDLIRPDGDSGHSHLSSRGPNACVLSSLPDGRPLSVSGGCRVYRSQPA